MRKLSKKQKNIIKNYVDNNFFDDDSLINKYNNKFILIRQLEKINDYETLYQDVNRLIDSLLFIDTIEAKKDYIDKFI